MDCLFCTLIANEIPSHTVYEDSHTRAFLDIGPSAPGHTMVIHKKHGATIGEYTQEELGELMATVARVARALQDALGTTVLSIGINHGEPLGVKHVHVHIIPRTPSDGGKVIQSLASVPMKESLDQVKEKVTSQISMPKSQ